jgi:adenylate cyclase
MASPTVCPHCGQPPGNGDSPLDPSAAELAQELEHVQAQLIAYAKDLARAYVVQRHMAQYIPSGLRSRISQGAGYVAGERRYVTVLFADIVDFTRLASRLDPEEIFSLVNTCFQRLVSHIFKYEGTLDKFIGDGMMALFGAPVAHEDDPDRAVWAALDMQAEMKVISMEMQPKLGAPLEIRIGLHSGEAIAGSIGVDQQLAYTVMGETVNLAWRLHELAEPGGIVVTEALYRRTEHSFDYEPLGDYSVKGIAEPVAVFGVLGRREPQILRQPAGDIHLPLTGRDPQMAQLADLGRRLIGGQGGVVAVLGEAGLGKTRLVNEWLSTLPPGKVTIWAGAAHMYQQRIGYSLWRDLLRQALKLRTGDLPPTEIAARQALLAQIDDLNSFILALVHNRTPESESHLRPENAQSGTLQAVRALVVAQAQRGPLLLVVDNWQWTDDLSRELLLSLLPLADQYPILFCILSRPASEPTYDPLQEIREIKAHCRQIELLPLWLADSWKLLSSLIVTDNLPDEAPSIILARTQGNPFYLEELVRLMIGEGILRPDGDRWQFTQPERLASLRTPPTLNGLARANLDRLPSELQEILNYAAVIGPTFSIGLLQAVIAHEREINALPDRLQRLAAYGIIKPITSDGHTFAFQHTMVQETIYSGLLSHRRQALHRLVADELEILPENDSNTSIELLAHHFIQAGVPARAVPYLIRAGRRAQSRFANKSAIEYYLAALAALDYAPRYERERADLEVALGDTYSRLRQYDEAIAHFKRALSASEDPELRADVRRRMGDISASQSDWGQAWEHLEQALECLADGSVAATSIVRGEVYADCASVEWRLGDAMRAELWAREAIAILECSPEPNGLAACYETLSGIYADMGQDDLAGQYAEKGATLRHYRVASHSPHTAYLLERPPRAAAM